MKCIILKKDGWWAALIINEVAEPLQKIKKETAKSFVNIYGIKRRHRDQDNNRYFILNTNPFQP
jgi:hypothetical protein